MYTIDNLDSAIHGFKSLLGSESERHKWAKERKSKANKVQAYFAGMKEQLKQCVQYEVWTVLYFPFIRLLGLPIVDIHIYTGDCYTEVTLRAEGPYYTDFKKQH